MDEGTLHIRLNSCAASLPEYLLFRLQCLLIFQLFSYFLGLLVDFQPKVVPDTYLHLFIQHIKKFFTLLSVCVLITLMA